MAETPPTLTFLGAALTVTGSRYLLTGTGGRLLVDCGLFQGRRELRQLNWEDFPVPAAEIDAVVLSHAHLDHCGYLPALVAQGFSGPVYCSKATAALAEILLLDAAHLQEEEAAYRNRKGYSRHKPALPLFDTRQAQRALKLLQPVEVRKPLATCGAEVTLHPNGHILGSCSVDVALEGRRITFTGDLGRSHDLQMPAPEPPRYCDYLVTESTYGNRLHGEGDVAETVADLVSDAIQRGGSVLIPSFAVGRAQLILHLLSQLRREGRIPPVAIYLDSPMAIAATEVASRFSDLSRFSRADMQHMREDVQLVATAEQSKGLGLIQMPIIIISASGMATGGRVLFHLRRMLVDHRNLVLFSGYQAPGTRGAKLVAGDRTIKIHGRPVEVQAEVESLDFLSAHADYEELIEWLRKIPVAPKGVFVTHGEPESAEHLCEQLQRQLGWAAQIPGPGDVAEL